MRGNRSPRSIVIERDRSCELRWIRRAMFGEPLRAHPPKIGGIDAPASAHLVKHHRATGGDENCDGEQHGLDAASNRRMIASIVPDPAAIVCAVVHICDRFDVHHVLAAHRRFWSPECLEPVDSAPETVQFGTAGPLPVAILVSCSLRIPRHCCSFLRKHPRGSPVVRLAITMASIDDERDPQVQQLERMKNEFLLAQQRRRERAAASRRGGTGDGDGPPLAGPTADGQRGTAALRP
jgi:hypothetical protein